MEATPVPSDLGQQTFTDEERAAKERQIRQVERTFGPHVETFGKEAPFLPDALVLYAAMTDPATAFWVKATIASALDYFISPFDMIPDTIPVAGMSDDGAVIATAMYVVGPHLEERHRRAARGGGA